MSPRRRGSHDAAAGAEYDSGLRVVTEEMPGVRSVTLGIWVDVGSRDERPSVAGASHFLEHLLFKGTKTRTAQDIAEAFDAVGGGPERVQREGIHVLPLPRARPGPADGGGYMGDMLQGSTIAKADVDGERGVILEEIGMRDDAPDDLIHDLFAETLWKGHPARASGPGHPGDDQGDHPRAGATGSTGATIARRRSSSPRPATCGTRSSCGLLEGASDTGRRLPDSDAHRTVRLGGSAPASPGARWCRTSKTEQAHLAWGPPGCRRSDPDRFAFGVVNVALGGGMSSRLFQEIREKRGLAYSVYSYHSQFAETGLFCVYAGTMPGRAEGGPVDRPRRALGDGRRTASAPRSSNGRRAT